MKEQQKTKELVKGFIDTIPLGIGALIYGIVYGVMACKAGSLTRSYLFKWTYRGN